MRQAIVAVAAVFLLAGQPDQAQAQHAEANASFIFKGERIEIRPDMATAAPYAARFAAMRSACDPACFAPMSVADGIETIDENMVLAFLVETVSKNEGLLLVDARMPDARAQGFIPGSVSLPATTLAQENRYQREVLNALGVRMLKDILNFAGARDLVVYDAGPDKNDANGLVANLLAVGYPVEKIKYYRGGMKVWSVLGLTVTEGSS